MDVLWEKKAATVGDIHEALPKDPPVAYNTVLTTLRILEQKGYIRHTKEGRAFVYHPVIDRGEASRKAVRHLISRFFQNSPELLMLNLLEDEEVSPEDLKRLKKMIEGE